MRIRKKSNENLHISPDAAISLIRKVDKVDYSCAVNTQSTVILYSRFHEHETDTTNKSSRRMRNSILQKISRSRIGAEIRKHAANAALWGGGGGYVQSLIFVLILFLCRRSDHRPRSSVKIVLKFDEFLRSCSHEIVMSPKSIGDRK